MPTGWPSAAALEATGVYWIPLFEPLESRGFEVLLVDPRQTRIVKGRPKADRRDCQWIQRLHRWGLLAGSFRPADQVVVLRGYPRQRPLLIRYAGQHLQHMQKASGPMNVKLAEVVSDLTGKTGLDLRKAVLGGARHPQRLAKLRNQHDQASAAGIAQALRGSWRPEHLFALRQAVALGEYYQGPWRACDEQSERQRGALAGPGRGPAAAAEAAGAAAAAPRAGRRRPGAGVPSGGRGPDGGRGDRPGDGAAAEQGDRPWRQPLPEREALRRLAGAVPTAPHQRVRPGVNRAARALRLAARGLHASQNAPGAFDRRMRARLGAQKAIVAAAHKLTRLVYALLKHGEAYVARAQREYEGAYRVRRVKGLARQAEELGYRLEPAAR